MVRKLVGILGVFIAIAVSSFAHGQTNQQADPNRRAYGYALRCAATAAGVYTDPRSTSAEKSAADASYGRAYDAAMRMGRVLGLSSQHVGDDMAASVRVEAALQLRDAAYYRRTQAECRQLGM
jgi:hypothetical protein